MGRIKIAIEEDDLLKIEAVTRHMLCDGSYQHNYDKFGEILKIVQNAIEKGRNVTLYCEQIEKDDIKKINDILEKLTFDQKIILKETLNEIFE